MAEETAPLSFQECVLQIESTLGDGNVDDTRKLNSILLLVKRYFEDEEIGDLLEGFLHLLVEVKHRTALFSRNIATKVLQAFAQFVEEADEIDKDIIYDSVPVGKAVYFDALKVATKFKPKHLKMIDSVFRLQGEDIDKKVLIPLIKEILQADQIDNAMQWIIYFDLRDHFQYMFQEVICHLILTREFALLEKYVGEDMQKRKRFILYLNKLVGMLLKNFQGHTELEQRALEDGKKLLQIAVKYLKEFDLPDSLAPNVLDFRSRLALIASHYKWKNGEISAENLETTALQSMQRSAYVCRYYLDYLCLHEMQSKALFYALWLGQSLDTFPPKLRYWCGINPSQVPLAEEEVKQKKKLKREQQKLDREKTCNLEEGPIIFWIDTWMDLVDAMDELEDEFLIGIDTEGMPHFSSTKEQVALIQVACSEAVFLIDVITLKERLSDAQWTKFFEVLLCSEDSRKIGFDFNNDLRFLKSTFPFLVEVFSRMKNVICLYRLLSQVLLMPDASNVVFGCENFTMNLNLHDVSKFLLNIELNKSERIGNWAQRPLRLEQKKYAAMDAFSLIGCFKEISNRLLKLDNSEMFKVLNDAALLKSVEKTEKSNEAEQESNEIASKRKETDEEFFTHVSQISSEIKATKPSSSLRNVNDFKFVVDAMLLGLGNQMRRCGFDIRQVNDQMRLVRYCEENPEVMVISAGKAFKKLQLCLPSSRLLCVPINTCAEQPNSQLLGFVMRQSNIVIEKKDMWSRCIKCNTASFCRLPRLIVKAIFFSKALQYDLDWLRIKQDDVLNVLQELRTGATAAIKPEKQESMEEQYEMIVCRNQIVCWNGKWSLDVVNRLMSIGEHGPMEIKIANCVKQEFLDKEDMHFFACLECGNIQYNCLGESS